MKQILVFCGLPGCGKSTTAEAVAKELKLPIFSVDPIESAVIKSGIEKSFETGLAAYLVAETLAGEQLKLGQSVIIDAVCAIPGAKDIWRNVAQRHGVALVIIECFCSDENTHKQRIEARVRGLHGIREITWEGVQQRKAEYTDWKEPVCRVDTMNSTKANVKKIIEYVKAVGR